jgi:hypothetical protein
LAVELMLFAEGQEVEEVEDCVEPGDYWGN